ncbi:mechanosensitive ion channel family protein [Colwellia sp. RSH04]|uniref:mechanosensitive ion channel family protein n=1 Tax=Colwellia sp. RSH04 TaxID=2305464 RepID=UPI000E56D7C2|nr:mechanosensitive ion channel domain-containing protein [Colwellia sp. RSH04]RHW74927.1 mechanosensitive ion channel family protein [Colwellia sp. RSH04]
MELTSNFKLALTIGAIILAIILKVFISTFLKKRYKKKGLDKRYLVNNIKNAINLMLIVLLFFFWSTELQRFALSIAAFVVAIVIATKEIIQCFIGFIYLSTSAPFRIGDWVQVNDNCGEVSEIDWAKVTLLEVDIHTYSYTGKTIYLPNSLLMLQSIRNLNFMRRYVNHSFAIVRESTNAVPINLISELKQKAITYCSSFKDVAERYNALIENRLDVAIAGPEPSIKISTTDIGHVKITFSLFCPTEDAIEIEQKLTTDFFVLWNNYS